jgi:hypothetical protein
MPRKSNAAAPSPYPQPNILSMNTLPQHQPREWIPDMFSRAQQVRSSITPGFQGPAGGDIQGIYDPPTSSILLKAQPLLPPAEVAGHEAGHAIYLRDLTPQQQAQWAQLHRGALDLYHRTANLRNIVRSVARYPSDPPHSFAETYGMYVNSPQELQKQSPDIYNFIRNLSGFEYSRRKQ